FGWSRSSAIGENFLNLVCPADKRDAYERELNKLPAVGKRESRMFSFQCINKHGHRFPVEASATPIEFGDGTVVCWFVRDISRRQEYEQALARARDQAISASEEKARFLASMSHEIRTPLNAVIGLSDLLGRSNLNEEQRQLTQVIVSSGNILLDLINSILDYSKLEAGKLELELVEFDFRDIIEGTAEIFATNAKDKGISLMTHVAPQTPRKVRGDPGRIRQILMNLVDNALKFTEEGEVTIRTTLERHAGERAIVKVSVSDTGIGFSSEVHEQLFLPFKQAGAQISRTFGGTGLGLSICKKLIEMMGGTIGVESSPGKGSTFSFSLPFEVCVEPVKYPRPEPLTNMRVMIIDGPPGSSEILRDYCLSWGMYCELVDGWGAASDRFTRNGSYDFAFVDQMAVENSWISEETLRNQIKLQDTKFVYVTSSSDAVVGEDALAMGYSACLVRPLKQSHLLDCMLRLVHDEDVYMHPKLVVEENSKSERQNLSGLILVVEDNPVNQKVALLQLRELGLSAHAVGNGREALAATEQTNYELILMDCQMPEMDGYETTRLIRKRESPEGKRTPIIAMTANAMPGDREKCLAAGMDDYIAKPVNQEKLQQMTSRWITRRDEYSGGAARERDPLASQVVAPAVKTETVLSVNSEWCRKSAIPPVELDMLAKTYGEEAREDILQSFVEEMEKILSRVEAKFQDKDENGLSDLFHQIKGMSSSIFAVDLARLARNLELSTREEDIDWSHAYDEFTRFLDTYTEARCYIRAECSIS
ncbi:MAG: response regulator, partial [Cyanobacteria bacterium]|nr:response regulator [Cyanobacteriota bacterium]